MNFANKCGYICEKNDRESCVHYSPELKHRFRLHRFDTGEDYFLHILRYDTLMILLEGSVEMSVNDNKLILHAGEMIALPLFAVITTKVLIPVRVVSLTLPPNGYHQCLSREVTYEAKGYGQGGVYISRPLYFTPEIRSLIDQMIFYTEQIPDCGWMHREKMDEFVLMLCLCYDRQELSAFLDPLLRKEQQFVGKINRNLDRFTSVDSMAETLHMSPSVFNRTFKETFGQPPYKWLLKQKSRVILQYVSSTHCTIADLTEKFDFTSPSHFHRFCISQFGCTPAGLFKKVRISQLK